MCVAQACSYQMAALAAAYISQIYSKAHTLSAAHQPTHNHPSHSSLSATSYSSSSLTLHSPAISEQQQQYFRRQGAAAAGAFIRAERAPRPYHNRPPNRCVWSAQEPHWQLLSLPGLSSEISYHCVGLLGPQRPCTGLHFQT